MMAYFHFSKDLNLPALHLTSLFSSTMYFIVHGVAGLIPPGFNTLSGLQYKSITSAKVGERAKGVFYSNNLQSCRMIVL